MPAREIRTFGKTEIPDRMFFKIGEVSKLTGVEPYVLRYWETEFDELRPNKSAANQRVYEKKDIENVMCIRNLLWSDRFSIAGARHRLKEIRKEKRKSKHSEVQSQDHQKIKKIKSELKDLIRLLRLS